MIGVASTEEGSIWADCCRPVFSSGLFGRGAPGHPLNPCAVRSLRSHHLLTSGGFRVPGCSGLAPQKSPDNSEHLTPNFEGIKLASMSQSWLLGMVYQEPISLLPWIEWNLGQLTLNILRRFRNPRSNHSTRVYPTHRGCKEPWWTKDLKT